VHELLERAQKLNTFPLVRAIAHFHAMLREAYLFLQAPQASNSNRSISIPHMHGRLSMKKTLSHQQQIVPPQRSQQRAKWLT